MRVAVIGRTEMLFESMLGVAASGHDIALVATAKASAESKARPDDFEAFATARGAPFIFAERFKSEHVELMRAANADVAITMNWPTMIRGDAVSCFRHGIVNAHGSDLPKYRGNACPNWAILEGDEQIGLSFHYIDPDGLDTGDVLLKKFTPNHSRLYIQDVYDWLAKAVPEGFADVIGAIATGNARPIPQDERAAIRAYPRRPDDGRLRFQSSADLLQRLVRASSKPFPGAFCFYEGREKVIVWRASLVAPPTRILAAPGQIMHFEAGKPVVACGDGMALRFDEFSVDSGAPLKHSVRARFT